MSAAAIQLLLRNDFPKKSGGDLVLARQYELALADSGHNAQIQPLSRRALEQGAGVAHLFNVDRYFEFAASASALQRAGRPYVVSPVHHPLSHVDYFESKVRSGALKVVSALGRSPFGRERIKHVVRGHSGRSIAESLLNDPRASISQALRDASLVVVQAPSELDELERTFGADVRGRAVWIPNGVSYEAGPQISGTRDIDVLVAGRIEERKNQLGIARALAGTPWNVTFVGANNPRNASYTRKFHRLLGEYENLRHVPHVSLDELRQMYVRSKVFLSASFFEVVSLAELEAVAYGCQLISATSGYLRDYLGDLATYVDPTAKPDVLRHHVESAMRAGINGAGMTHVRNKYSWAASHRRLVDAYQEAGLLSG
jgi:glycosyltransferase involved in cell wall biosynthesis